MKNLLLGVVILIFFHGLRTEEIKLQIPDEKNVDFLLLLRHKYRSNNVPKEAGWNVDSEELIDLINQDQNVESKKKHHGSVCRVCIYEVWAIEMYLNKTKTPAEVQKAFNQTCDVLKAPYKAGCYKFFNSSGLDAIKAMLKGVNPKQICQNLKACRRKMLDSEVTNFQTGMPFSFVDLSKKSQNCKACILMVKYMEKVYDSSKTVAFITKKLSSVCDIYYSNITKYCIQYLQAPSFQEFLKDILAHKCPYRLCKKMGACRRRHLDTSKESLQPLTSRDMCQSISQLLDKFDSQEKTGETINSALDQICVLLPAVNHQQCLDFVKNNRLDLLQGILTGMKDELCIENDQLEDEPSKHRKNLRCHKCYKGVSRYEHMINRSKSANEVLNMFTMTCDVLVPKRRKMCQDFLKKKGLKAIRDILKGVSSWKICKDVGVCKRKENLSEEDFLSGMSVLIERDRKHRSCEHCQKAVRHYEKVMDKTKSAGFVIKRLSMLCDSLKTKYQWICKHVITGHKMVDFIKSVLKNESPLAVCQRMKRCHKKEITAKDTLFFLPETELL